MNDQLDHDQFKGAYISWKLSRRCSETIHQWCKRMGVVDPVLVGQHHCTIMYSPERALHPDMHGEHALPRPWQHGGYTAPVATMPRRTDVLGRASAKGALVSLLDAPALAQRHRWFRDEHMLRHSFDGFIPHVTLAYNFQQQDPSSMVRLVQTPLPCPLHFDVEYRDWCDKPKKSK